MSLEHKIEDLLEQLAELRADLIDDRETGILQLTAERDQYREALQAIQQRVGVTGSTYGEILRDPIQIATQALTTNLDDTDA